MVMRRYYDIAIVGAGPAGIFASLELSNAGLGVLLLDKGRDISGRVCPIQDSNKYC